jgi:hypothetical protein
MATNPRELLDHLDALHNRVIYDDNGAEWLRLTQEHDALPGLTAALRAVLDVHQPVSQNDYAAVPLDDPADVCSVDNTTAYPCRTVRSVIAALDRHRPPGPISPSSASGPVR